MSPDFLRILETLSRYQVDFIVTGGVCGVLHGAPITTFDLDIVHDRNSSNIARLMQALTDLEAHYRSNPDLRIVPKFESLTGPGHHLLNTRLGPLDILGFVGNNHTYAELSVDAVRMDLATCTVRIQSLSGLIRVKEELAMEKDKFILPILYRCLEEKRTGN